MKILILCTGNSCRSQMAEGFLKSFDPRLVVYSAGTQPASQVNPYAVEAMEEAGINISGNKPTSVDNYLSDSFDYVITVCDNAKETCPFFSGHVQNRLHMGFEDPAEAQGSHDEVMPVFRRVRDEIRAEFLKLYQERLKPETDKEGSSQGKCDCSDGCCQPKKRKLWPAILFTLILLAAAGIIIAKLFFSTPESTAAGMKDGNSSCSGTADSTSSKSCCDTTKSSSCCPK